MKKYLGGIIIGIILLSILRLILNNMEINEQNENRNITLQKCVEGNFSNEECKKLISDFKKYLEKNDIKSQ